MVEIVSETIRVSKQTKEALLKVAARLQEHAGRRIDLDEAIAHLVKGEDKSPEAFLRFVGSIRGPEASELLDELAGERERDESRTERKYGL